ncbi:MAG: DUF5615 family PIN-like protein [Pyrinomonadaceae bacterium]|nr:DUF5615 family PIN-like protein [Pyrinomonadaceae bacterium]MBP6213797.1 DUF5615 family PIN-like protein [Pyrinomonadaceae bacterium]
MKILIDECVPSIVKKRLPNRNILTVQDMGWSGTKNGALLTLAESDFDIFITSDKNLRYQQNLSGRRIAFIVLPSNQIPVVISLITRIDAVIETIGPSDFIEI